jgi:SAM-dependent methyltransferase
MIGQEHSLLHRPPNGFDNLVVDVATLHREFPVEDAAQVGGRWSSPLQKFYASPLAPLSARNAVWHLFRRVGLDLTWFERFKKYWGKVLDGRPLWGVEDFYFLRNIYRMRFQSAVVRNTAEAGEHLEDWQRPEVLSHLFHSVYKESLFNELRLLLPARALFRGRIRKTLEFGCGTAPITTTLCEFFPPRGDVHAWIADIETISFHYAAHKLAAFRNVHPVALRPERQFRFPEGERFDAIFCMTVLEHLQDPLATVEHLHRLLGPGGLLVFDYVKSDAGGLDTRAGLEQRPAVLEYVRRNFDILRGILDEHESMGTVIARVR